MNEGREQENTDLPKPAITRQTLRETWQLLGYIRPYWRKLSAALVCLGLGSLLTLAVPFLAGSLVQAGQLHLENATTNNWLQDLRLLGLGLIVVLVLQAVATFLRTIWFAEVGERGLADLRRDTYARLIRLPMVFHASRRVGELASRVSADLTSIRQTLIDGVPHFLREGVVLVGGVILLAVTSLRLTAIMLVSVPVLVILSALFQRILRRVARDTQDRLAETSVIVEETLQNVASVKSFANEPFEEGRYRHALKSYVGATLRGAFFEGTFNAFVVLALFGSIVLVLWCGAQEMLAGAMTAGDLTSFMLYTMFVGGAVSSFADLYGQIQRMVGANQRVRDLLRETPEPGGNTKPAERLRGDLSIENVSFRYPSRPEVAVFNDVSLTAKAGQRIALVGPSGAGKSTLVSLLLRFYEPNSGRILIDGRDARDYDLQTLRSQMAVVPQDVILFGGTIADNIAYGRSGASQAEIEDAAREANAHEFIFGFPQGYQTRVGERGVQLSGGQRQRVAIARAILRDPAILLLDEATSALDSESESLVLQALDRLMQGRTALVIAHRLSTVRGADRIFVLKEGSVVESGQHGELMQRADGVYRNLSLLQLVPDASFTPKDAETHFFSDRSVVLPP